MLITRVRRCYDVFPARAGPAGKEKTLLTNIFYDRRLEATETRSPNEVS